MVPVIFAAAAAKAIVSEILATAVACAATSSAVTVGLHVINAAENKCSNSKKDK